MALIKCPECSREISDSAKICPICGYPISRKSKSSAESNQDNRNHSKTPLLISVILLGLIILLLVPYGLTISVFPTLTTAFDFIFIFLLFICPLCAIGSVIAKLVRTHKGKESNGRGKAAVVYLLCAVACFISIGFFGSLNKCIVENCSNSVPDANRQYCDEHACYIDNVEYKYMDDDFKSDIVDAVSNRLKQGENDDDLSTIIASEEARLSKYYGVYFSDAELCDLVSEYLDGLALQKAALDCVYSAHQITWNEGMVMRYHALVNMQERYNLFSNVEGFDDAYTFQLDNAESFYNSLEAIDNDLLDQLIGKSFGKGSPYELIIPYTNNTDYPFSIKLFVVYSDSNDVVVYTDVREFVNITPGSGNSFLCYFPFDTFQNLGISKVSYRLYWEIYC